MVVANCGVPASRVFETAVNTDGLKQFGYFVIFDWRFERKGRVSELVESHLEKGKQNTRLHENIQGFNKIPV